MQDGMLCYPLGATIGLLRKLCNRHPIAILTYDKNP